MHKCHVGIIFETISLHKSCIFSTIKFITIQQYNTPF